MSYKGYFISLEGIEGCGKSTQAKKLALYLEEHGYPLLLTKEPGGTVLGGNIRKLLLCPQQINITPEAELFLYAADRTQHVQEIILPALEAGKIVICDRFIDATMAYQGYARGLDKAIISKLNTSAAQGIKPQLTILLDLPVEEGLNRALARNQQVAHAHREDRFEREGATFHERVRQGYLSLARAEPQRIKVVKADNSPAQVHREIVNLLSPLIEQRGAP